MTNFMPAKHASKSEKNMLVLYKNNFILFQLINYDETGYLFESNLMSTDFDVEEGYTSQFLIDGVLLGWKEV